MSYVVPRRSGGWELRRSVSTQKGPRSRTLVGFRVLTADVVARAIERANGELDADEVRQAARRAGAPVARDPALAAAASLLGELSRGARLPRSWRGAIRDLVDGEAGEAASEAERAVAAWADATPTDRGKALWDLLLLADRLPAPRRQTEPGFPGFGGGR